MSLGDIIVLVFISVYIIVSACFRWKPSMAIATALALLIASAITLALGQQYLSEQLVICTFYLLVVGIVLLLLQHIRKGSKRSN